MQTIQFHIKNDDDIYKDVYAHRCIHTVLDVTLMLNYFSINIIVIVIVVLKLYEMCSSIVLRACYILFTCCLFFYNKIICCNYNFNNYFLVPYCNNAKKVVVIYLHAFSNFISNISSSAHYSVNK